MYRGIIGGEALLDDKDVEVYVKESAFARGRILTKNPKTARRNHP
jgi:hypothetical protein